MRCAQCPIRDNCSKSQNLYNSKLDRPCMDLKNKLSTQACLIAVHDELQEILYGELTLPEKCLAIEELFDRYYKVFK